VSFGSSRLTCFFFFSFQTRGEKELNKIFHQISQLMGHLSSNWNDVSVLSNISILYWKWSLRFEDMFPEFVFQYDFFVLKMISTHDQKFILERERAFFSSSPNKIIPVKVKKKMKWTLPVWNIEKQKITKKQKETEKPAAGEKVKATI
jgi:hypothetical protein